MYHITIGMNLESSTVASMMQSMPATRLNVYFIAASIPPLTACNPYVNLQSGRLEVCTKLKLFIKIYNKKTLHYIILTCSLYCDLYIKKDQQNVLQSQDIDKVCKYIKVCI